MSGREALMKRLTSCTVWCAFMRATMRLPSYSRSWIDVVGLLSSTPSHSPAAAALLLAAAWLLPAPALLLAPRVWPEPPKATYLQAALVHSTINHQDCAQTTNLLSRKQMQLAGCAVFGNLLQK